MYDFISVAPNGQTRKWGSVKEAFDGKRPDEQVFVVVKETGSRFKVLRF